MTIHTEDWGVEECCLSIGDRGIDLNPYKPDQRLKAIEAVPLMVRTLLQVEWIDVDQGEGCPGCSRLRATPESDDPHEPGCCVDEALKAAGYPDAASRDKARKDLQR
jgi:hypothetical protein